MGLTSSATFVGVMGAHGTGKTTLMDHVAHLLRLEGFSVGRIDAAAREAAGAGLPSLRNHTATSTARLMLRGALAELEISFDYDVVLVDRAVPDALSYWLAALDSRGEVVVQDDHDYLFGLGRLHATGYSVLVRSVLEPRYPLPPDGRRDADLKFRSAVDTHTQTVCRLLGTETVDYKLNDQEEVGALIVRHLVENRNR